MKLYGNNMKLRMNTHQLIRLMMGLLLITSSLGKTVTYDLTVSGISTGFGLSIPSVSAIIIFVIILEIILGIGIIISASNGIILTACITFAMFTLLSIAAYALNTPGSCYCFGAAHTTPWGISVIARNMLSFYALYTLVMPYRPELVNSNISVRSKTHISSYKYDYMGVICAISALLLIIIPIVTQKNELSEKWHMALSEIEHVENERNQLSPLELLVDRWLLILFNSECPTCLEHSFDWVEESERIEIEFQINTALIAVDDKHPSSVRSFLKVAGVSLPTFLTTKRFRNINRINIVPEYVIIHNGQVLMRNHSLSQLIQELSVYEHGKQR